MNKEKYILLLLMFISTIIVNAQVGDGSIPYSLTVTSNNRQGKEYQKINCIVVGRLDNNVLLLQDSLSRTENDNANTFAVPIEVNKEIQNYMTWDTIENGYLMGRIQLQSPTAYASFLIFDDFYLPPNTKLYAYNADGSQYIGAFTQSNNKSYGRFSLGPIIGETITLEIIRPANIDSTPRLHIASYIHSYKDIFQSSSRGGCNYIDVKCKEADWCNQIRSVARVMGLNTEGKSTCFSGALITNEKRDLRPYLLTANHCYENCPNTFDWIFLFNFQSSGCGDNYPISPSQTLIGATLKANNCYTDFALLELSDPIPSNYNVFYSGWNREDEKASEGASISHPDEYIKKIALYNTKIKKKTNGKPCGNGDWMDMWRVQWNIGNVEHGSSGGPLYNKDGYLIGQQSTCWYPASGGSCPTGAYFGRFCISWNDGSSSSKRLKDWLNPNYAKFHFISTGGEEPCKESYTFTNANDLHTSDNVVFSLPFQDPMPGTRTYNGVYTASGTITAGNNVTIQSGTGKSVEFYAEKIVLLPGFKAEAGSHFIASAKPCQRVCSGGRGNDDEASFVVLDTLISNENKMKYHKANETGYENIIKDNENIEIHPNPNTGTFTIETDLDPQEIIRIQVLNMLGQSIYQQVGLPSNTIQLPSSEKGLFYVEIITATQRIIRKIVVL